jgi:hypothetical protein
MQMAASQSYRGTPSQYNQQPPQHHQQPLQQSYSQPLSQQQPPYGYSQQPPASAQPYQQPQQQQQQPPATQAPVQQATNPSQQPLQAPPSHHIPPTGQYTEAGQPILFYVKAIYKYDATSAEEFSFQKDDVIGVYGEFLFVCFFSSFLYIRLNPLLNLQKLTTMDGGRESCWIPTGPEDLAAICSRAISQPSWIRSAVMTRA